MTPYFQNTHVALYHADFRDGLELVAAADAVVTDPPYGETSLVWDRWPDGWPAILATTAIRSLWCFGSLRMFMRHASDFGDWRFSHDVVWEKHNGSSFVNDRFKRVHEVAAHFYRGAWETVYRCPPVTNDARRREVRRKARPPHMGEVGESRYKSEDGGPRLARSVQYVRSCHGSAIHPTQKPTGILRPLIEYATPSGGTVADLFAGSGSLLKAAQQCGRRAIGFETQEKHCEAAARHLAQGELVAS